MAMQKMILSVSVCLLAILGIMDYKVRFLITYYLEHKRISMDILQEWFHTYFGSPI
jgi:hypothetical protein